MDHSDILLEVMHDLTRELEENANESDKQYCPGQIHGVELAITLVNTFFKEERIYYLKDSNTQGCNHDFKQYNGFTESYRYCTKCDEKEK